jgi:hypothetical protein
MTEKILLAAIPRSATEQVHIQISEYKGKKFLDLRVFYTKDGGLTWNPTQKGVTVYPENFDLLIEAVNTAKKELD